MATKASTPRAATERRVSQRAVPAGDRRERMDADRRSASESSALSAEQIHNLIAETAYYRAEERGFAPGLELEDWLAAEAQVEATLSVGRARNN